MKEGFQENKENIINSDLPTLIGKYNRGVITTEYKYKDGSKITSEIMNDLEGMTNVEKRKRIIQAIRDGIMTGTLIMTIIDGKKKFTPNLFNLNVKKAMNSQGEEVKLNKRELMDDVFIRINVMEEFKDQIIDLSEVTNSLSQLSVDLYIKGIKSYLKIPPKGNPIVIFDEDENKEEVEKALESAWRKSQESGIMGTSYTTQRVDNHHHQITSAINMYDPRFL